MYSYLHTVVCCCFMHPHMQKVVRVVDGGMMLCSVMSSCTAVLTVRSSTRLSGRVASHEAVAHLRHELLDF